MAEDLLGSLQTGPARRFADWPDPTVPKIAAGVYTIWDDQRFVYVGMAGRAITEDRVSSKPTGLWDRLRSHADGRRSGNQFCIYVCDRFIVPNLTPDEQAQIGAGTLSLDHLTRRYIHDKLTYRYVLTTTPGEAMELERQVQSGVLNAGVPFLNPLRSSTQSTARPVELESTRPDESA